MPSAPPASRSQAVPTLCATRSCSSSRRRRASPPPPAGRRPPRSPTGSRLCSTPPGPGFDVVVAQGAAGRVGRGHAVAVSASYEEGPSGHRPYRLEQLGVPAMRYAPLYDLEARRRARIAGLAAKPHDVFFVETQPFFSL